MNRKLMICQWFGPLPDWYDHWLANTRRLQAHGYDFLIDTDQAAFRQRIHDRLGVTYPDSPDPRKPCAYRPAFGDLYADELDGYRWWGHTDLDIVYGRVQHWLTDDFLDEVDIFCNHHDYVSGPWSLYRNIPVVNSLYRRHPDWRAILENPVEVGWAETSYTAIMDAAHDAGEIRRRYAYYQTRNLNRFDSCYWDGDKLMEGPHEVFMAHFRRLQPKVYPERLRL